MATETENYANKGLATAAKTRGAQRHIDGWRPINTSFNPDGTVTITWNDDPLPPPTPDQIELEQLREKIQNETMTPNEVPRYLKLAGL